MKVLQALLDARIALAANHNVLATDRPDLPRAPDTGWTTDFAREIAGIDAAIFALTGDIRTCRGCGRCSTSLERVPSQDRAICAPERLDNHRH